jgi:uncharacterized protein with ParB-like and HNH nuclease domain
MLDDEEVYFIEEEGTETEDDLGRQDTSTYSKAVLWGTDWTAETIVNQLRKNNINLDPEFQRRDAWDPNKKSKFIESLILGLPVPPLILAESREKRNSFIVIDGKQRLLTIMQFCANEEDENYNKYKLFLQKLEILEDINGKNYDSLDTISSSNDYKTQFDNQSIRTVVIKNWPDEKFLYTVFLRLNTGSLKLSPQELRQALHPGEFLSYINEYTYDSNIMKGVLKINKPDARMRDVELLIRYYAFKNYLNEYKGNLKEFLDNSCEKLNQEFKNNKNKYKNQLNEFETAIMYTTDIFGEKSRFSKYINGSYTNTFNRTIFDIMIYFFSEKEIRERLKNKAHQIKESFQNIMTNDKDFIESVGASTKDLDKTKKRYTKWEEALNKI